MKTQNFDQYLSNWSYTGNWLYVYHSLLEAPFDLDLEALGLSLHSLLVNPTLGGSIEIWVRLEMSAEL